MNHFWITFLVTSFLVASSSHALEYVWTGWSAWSRCSFSCGQGVRMRDRECVAHDGRRLMRVDMLVPMCPGRPQEHTVCEERPCSPDAPDTYTQQCTEKNNVLVSGKHHTWSPFTGVVDMASRCELACIAYPYKFYYNFGQVTDGTPCGDNNGDRKQLCVGGQCKTFGCDGVADSGKTLDWCKVCGGQNRNCSYIRDSFDVPAPGKDLFGYQLIVKIPRGATYIEVTDRSYNYLALSDANDVYLLNGDYKLDWSGEYPYAGTTVKYHRNVSIETIYAEGPTNMDLYAKIIFREHNPGVEYNFYLPIYQLNHVVKGHSSQVQPQSAIIGRQGLPETEPPVSHKQSNKQGDRQFNEVTSTEEEYPVGNQAPQERSQTNTDHTNAVHNTGSHSGPGHPVGNPNGVDEYFEFNNPVYDSNDYLDELLAQQMANFVQVQAGDNKEPNPDLILSASIPGDDTVIQDDDMYYYGYGSQDEYDDAWYEENEYWYNAEDYGDDIENIEDIDDEYYAGYEDEYGQGYVYFENLPTNGAMEQAEDLHYALPVSGHVPASDHNAPVQNQLNHNAPIHNLQPSLGTPNSHIEDQYMEHIPTENRQEDTIVHGLNGGHESIHFPRDIDPIEDANTYYYLREGGNPQSESNSQQSGLEDEHFNVLFPNQAFWQSRDGPRGTAAQAWNHDSNNREPTIQQQSRPYQNGQNSGSISGNQPANNIKVTPNRGNQQASLDSSAGNQQTYNRDVTPNGGNQQASLVSVPSPNHNGASNQHTERGVEYYINRDADYWDALFALLAEDSSENIDFNSPPFSYNQGASNLNDDQFKNPYIPSAHIQPPVTISHSNIHEFPVNPVGNNQPESEVDEVFHVGNVDNFNYNQPANNYTGDPYSNTFPHHSNGNHNTETSHHQPSSSRHPGRETEILPVEHAEDIESELEEETEEESIESNEQNHVSSAEGSQQESEEVVATRSNANRNNNDYYDFYYNYGSRPGHLGGNRRQNNYYAYYSYIPSAKGSYGGNCPLCPAIVAHKDYVCESDFMMRGVVESATAVRGDTRYEVRVIDELNSRIPLMSSEFVWARGTCPCPILQPGQPYIIMGRMIANLETRESRLMLEGHGYVTRDNPRHLARLRSILQTVTC